MKSTVKDTRTVRLHEAPHRSGDTRSVLPRSRISRRQAARRSVPQHEVGVQCSLCPQRVSKIKHHVKRAHLPFFWCPFTCCWICRVQFARESCLLRHIKEEHGGDTAANRTEQSQQWMPLVLGFLFAVASALGLVSLEALVAYAQAHDLLSHPEERNALDRQAQDLMKDLLAIRPYPGLQPEVIIEFLDWRSITGLLCKARRPLLVEFNQSDAWGVPIQFQDAALVVDAHFHLDRMLRHSSRRRLHSYQDATRHTFSPGRLCAAIAVSCYPEYWPLTTSELGPPGEVFHCWGIHPRRVGAISSDRVFPELSKLLDQPRTVALGEVGLDYFRDLDEAGRSEQRRVLTEALVLALEKKKPVVIHCRGYGAPQAATDLTRIAREVLPPFFPLYFHCFFESLSTFKILRSSFPNSIFGFSSKILSHPSLSELTSLCPLSHIVLETDAPYLTNFPGVVKEAAAHLARAHGLSTQRVCTITAFTAARFFRLPASAFPLHP